jgi:hypothetical protein
MIQEDIPLYLQYWKRWKESKVSIEDCLKQINSSIETNEIITDETLKASGVQASFIIAE